MNFASASNSRRCIFVGLLEGFSFHPPLRDPFTDVLPLLSSTSVPILSVDIPSVRTSPCPPAHLSSPYHSPFSSRASCPGLGRLPRSSLHLRNLVPRPPTPRAYLVNGAEGGGQVLQRGEALVGREVRAAVSLDLPPPALYLLFGRDGRSRADPDGVSGGHGDCHAERSTGSSRSTSLRTPGWTLSLRSQRSGRPRPTATTTREGTPDLPRARRPRRDCKLMIS